MMKRFKTGVFCAPFLVSFLLLVQGAFADIQMTTQLTDPQGSKGRINARIMQAYPNVDVYVGMITGAASLHCLRWNQTAKRFYWESGVHPFLEGVSLAPSEWITLDPIDLSLVTEDPTEAVFLLVLAKEGADPLDRQNWVHSRVVDFITHPLQRQPGQSLFASAGGTSQPILSPFAPDLSGAMAPPAEDDSSGAQPEKADIFRISGKRLFYANGSAMRFQMIDLTDPAKPVLLASVPMRETPRELFLVGEYAFLIGSAYVTEGPSTALRVYRANDTIQEVQRVDLDQLAYVTSRRLGNRIYLVGTTANGSEPCCEWRGPGQAAVYVLDITSPGETSVITHATAGSTVFDVYMDNRYLVLLGWDSWPATGLEIFDLTSEVPLSRKATLSIPGLVPSEHHIHATDSLLHAVYQGAIAAEGSTLAVYDLSDFSNISEAGHVGGIAPGEALFATRFTDERAYVVTYERQDPLWVLDISTPSLPRIVGELQVPGWSEYMEFFDDRLLAIGYDDSQGKRLISVALFSVSDPSSPVLLDRVTPLSEKASYSYSEATSDDRAFFFNQETGMVLFPIHYYEQASWESISGLEILKLEDPRDGFSWQSSVESGFHVLRGSETDETSIVLSMGDSALNTIDISTPPQTSVVGELRLAYNVAQVAGRDSSRRLWTLGTDFYGYGESELILFQGDNLDTPAQVEDTGLGWAQLLMNDQIGVLFEPQTPRIRAVDLQNVTLGGAVAIEGVAPWSLQSPLLLGQTFYVANATWAVLPWPEETLFSSELSSGEILGQGGFPMDAVFNPVQWQLLRFECSNFQAPAALPALSIPGRPIGFTAGRKLVTAEELSPYYQASSLIPPGPVDNNGGLLVNVLTIQQDQAILDGSRFFSYAEFGYATVLTDQRAVYVSFITDQSTTVITLSPADLSDIRIDAFEELLAPVEAFDGKLLVATYGGILPLSDGLTATDALLAPMPWGPPEVSVYDLTVNPSKKILSLEGEYVDAWGAAMDETGLYLAKGYAGVSFVPF
jgi:hypothetical protein